MPDDRHPDPDTAPPAEPGADPARRVGAAFALRMPSPGTLTAMAAAAAACLYFFNRIYAASFLGAFGLGAGVVPVAPQDAVADGYRGFVLNIFYFWTPIAAVMLVYVVAKTAEVLIGPGQPRRPRPASPPDAGRWSAAVDRLRQDPDHQLRTVMTLLTIIFPIVVIVATVLVALPAEFAAKRDEKAFRAAVDAGCGRCAVYVLGTRSVRGLPIGSTPERLFVFAAEAVVVPVRIDEITMIRPAGHAPR